jgi:hypothetical protein
LRWTEAPINYLNRKEKRCKLFGGMFSADDSSVWIKGADRSRDHEVIAVYPWQPPVSESSGIEPGANIESHIGPEPLGEVGCGRPLNLGHQTPKVNYPQ